ncbi:hypothetical protein ACHAXN_002274 [Cyclotella atomus]
MSRSRRIVGTQKLDEHHAQLNNKFRAFAVAVVLLALPSTMMTFNFQTPSEPALTHLDLFSVERNLSVATNKSTTLPPTCLVCLHIPKCGGRSVEQFLDSVAMGTMGFKEQWIYVWGNRNRNIKIGDLQIDNTFTIGHFTTLLFQEQPKFRDCFKVTLLREPVDRSISAYFFHGHKAREIDYCLQNPLQSRRCRYHWQYSNDMTRQLAGSRDRKWNTYFEHPINVPPPNRTHLESAKMKLMTDFDLVCFTDDLPSCATGVLDAFHLNRNEANANLTEGLSHMTATVKDEFYVTKTRPKQLDNTTMTKFIKVNELDLELYNWAVDHFRTT